MSEQHLPIFVYGTLQRGQERGDRWPCKPRLVQWAIMRGRLHDLGPYPALVEGEDRVLGELWHVEPGDLEVTLAELDAIECFGNDGVDLYVRRIVLCETLAGTFHHCYTYFYANPPEIARTPIVRPDGDGLCRWRRRRPMRRR